MELIGYAAAYLAAAITIIAATAAFCAAVPDMIAAGQRLIKRWRKSK